MSKLKCQKNYKKESDGFSLFEVLLAMGIIAVLGAVSTGYYRNYVKNVEFDSTVKTVVYDLKHAQSKAMAGEDDKKWGVHFVNGTNDDYYEIFSTSVDYGDASTVVKDTVYLPVAIAFISPAQGATSDIIFDKIAGTTSASSVSLNFEGSTSTVTVTAVGGIY